MKEEKQAYINNKDIYRVSPAEVQRVMQLPSAAYSMNQDMQGTYIQELKLKEEQLIDFSTGYTNDIMKEITKFWSLKDSYAKLGVPYKRGILLYGPPGTGKSGIVKIVSKKVIDKAGIVFYIKDTDYLNDIMPILCDNEKDRHMLVIFEDFDTMLHRNNEGDVLQLLDGISKIKEGILFLATTNHLENIPKRIYRPSRFDYLVEVKYPNNKTRETYIKTLSQRFGIKFDKELVKITENMPFAHMKELLIANTLYGIPINTCKERLKKHIEDLEEDTDQEDL